MNCYRVNLRCACTYLTGRGRCWCGKSSHWNEWEGLWRISLRSSVVCLNTASELWQRPKLKVFQGPRVGNHSPFTDHTGEPACIHTAVCKKTLFAYSQFSGWPCRAWILADLQLTVYQSVAASLAAACKCVCVLWILWGPLDLSSQQITLSRP